MAGKIFILPMELAGILSMLIFWNSVTRYLTAIKAEEEQQKAIRKKLAALKHVNLPNYLYINNHDYTFADVSEEAGINEPLCQMEQLMLILIMMVILILL